MLAKSFPTIVFFPRTELWIKSYGLLKLWPPHFYMSSMCHIITHSFVCGTDVALRFMHNASWKRHGIFYVHLEQHLSNFDFLLPFLSTSSHQSVLTMVYLTHFKNQFQPKYPLRDWMALGNWQWMTMISLEFFSCASYS